MKLSTNRKSQLMRLAGRSLARIIHVVQRTSTLVTEPADFADYLRSQKPMIFAGWHGQFMMVPAMHYEVPDVEFSAMVARHTDAEIIGAAVEQFDVTLIRGAGAGKRRKDRGGVHALRASITALEAGTSVYLTADVPPGPARRVGEGIIALARISGRPIIPAAAATSRYFALNTWSRITFNMPFSKLAYVVGDPIYVPADADENLKEEKRQEVENNLNAVTLKAFELAGADPKRATPKQETDDALPDPGLRLKSYRTLTQIVEPAAPLILRHRESKGKEDGSRRAERMGQAKIKRPPGTLAWFHAASVGETNAIIPVINALSEQRPYVKSLLTTGTVTSAKRASAQTSSNVIHQFAPLDAPGYVHRFLDHWKPNLAVFTESEIWPNLVMEASKRKIPLILANARLSSRSFERWHRNQGIARPLFARFDAVLAQNEELAKRFSSLGARNVTTVGNLKIDCPPPPADPNALSELKHALGNRPFFVAASTHDGEETIIAEAHRILAQSHANNIRTIIIPRHPERGPQVYENLKAIGFNVRQRSLGELPNDKTDIYLADTLGELGTFYALSPIAFIGGSLVNKGGQNPIEAIHHNAVVICGPHQENFRQIYDALQQHDAVIMVSNAQDIAQTVGTLLKNAGECAHRKAAAKEALTSLQGALARTIATLMNYVPEDERLRRAS